MIKNFILMCLGAFIVAFSYNHFDNLVVEIIICSLGFGLMFRGYGNMLTKPLLKRIKDLNFYSYIQDAYISSLENDISTYRFYMFEDELKEYKEFIDLFRRKYGSIVYKIEYSLESNNHIHECKFVKAYDMNEKEWIDEQCKSMHLFRHRKSTFVDSCIRSFGNKQEIEVEFNNKKYSCIVTSFKFTNELNAVGDIMVELDLVIVKEID